MTPERLLEHFDRIVEAPDAVSRLRRFILNLGVRGRLVVNNPIEEPIEPILSACSALSESIPTNWRCGIVGDLFKFEYGENLPQSKRNPTGDFPVYGSNGIVGSHDNCLIREPALIVGRKGSAGALQIAPGPSWTTDVAYFVRMPNDLDLRYSFYLFSTMGLNELGKGVKPGLSRKDVYDIPISIPPFKEQVRIVAKVDELMLICDRLEAAQRERESRRDRLAAASLHRLNKLSDERGGEKFREHVRFHLDHLSCLATRKEHVKQLRETILNLAVSGKLVPQFASDEPVSNLIARIQETKMSQSLLAAARRRTPAPIRHVPGESSFPSDWATVYFEGVTTVITSGSRGWAEYYSDSGPKFIRAQNIRFGRLRLDDLASVTPPKASEGARTSVSKGDLVIVATGAGVTNPALVDQDIGEAYVSQHVALVKPVDTKLSPWILLTLMAHSGCRSELVDRAYGAGKPGINLDTIRQLKLPLPPLPEQTRIVARVDELMAVCDALESHLEKADTGRAALLEAIINEALAPAKETS